MPQSYSPAVDDLGLGDGAALSQQVGDDEEERRKKLRKLSGGNPDQAGGANAMGLAAMSLLGSFRG